MKRSVNMIKNMPEELHVSKVDFLLTVVISAVAGAIIGMLISPRKNMIWGIYGNPTYNNGKKQKDSEEK